jgi:SAM-dependent methyltransferase
VSAATAPTAGQRAVVWHDAENSGYRADLSLWRELAERAGGPVLDIGAGTGRVSLYLATAGYDVSAVDISEPFIDALRRRAAEIERVNLEAEVADIRMGALEPRFALAIAPMQLLQLILGREERLRALENIRGALLPGGRAAFAIVEGRPEFEEGAMPLPDVREIEGWVYSSQPLGVGVEENEIVVRRLRQLVSPAGEMTEELDDVRLAVLTSNELEAEATTCGFRPSGRHDIPPTDDHVGSTVVELEAA